MSGRLGGGSTFDSAASRLGGLGQSIRGAYDQELQREPGTRRRKLAGYLKAANELRQTYQQSYFQSSYDDGQAEPREIPGAFPGVTMARSGDEELIIFPSYARRHIKRKPRMPENAPSPEELSRAAGAGESAGPGDPDFWRREWERYENDNAIVDVDVRGWLYTPHSGPMNRKTRLFVGLARQLSGVPAPPGASPNSSTPNSRSTSPHGFRQRLDANNKKYEDELAAKEAASIIRKGEAEATIAGEGNYSEKPGDDASSVNGNAQDSRHLELHMNEPAESESEEPYDDPRITPMQKRESWHDPSQMSAEELKTANKHLMTRLNPFLANPVVDVPVSAFFYNDEVSRQKTIETNAYGHFTLRAALDFIPTHVRILVNERLSATEEVIITEPHGVSVISDIDDTIKHSAIGGGAREIFRNVFIREYGDLVIQGVRDWYSSLAKLGVNFHYVSNSPWQLYPALTAYFKIAGLPLGSFHLKQYNGMLQGIFEPVAERKKGPLQKLLYDFPERSFILIGDSGEADLEVYTDIVLENPGRILGVFIRDITTPKRNGFFDTSLGPLSGENSRRAEMFENAAKTDLRNSRKKPQEDDPELKAAIAASLKEFDSEQQKHGDGPSPSDEKRPPLPPRRRSAPPAEEEDLIDLNWEEPAVPHQSNTGLPRSNSDDELPRTPPAPPPKPSKLSTINSQSSMENSTSSIPGPKAAPPIPRKPASIALQQRPAYGVNGPTKSSTDIPPPARITYAETARETLNSAYNSLPSFRSMTPSSRDNGQSKPPPPPISRRPKPVTSNSADPAAPPLPPNKPKSYQGAAAQVANNIYSSVVRPTSDTAQESPAASASDSEGTYAPPPGPPPRRTATSASTASRATTASAYTSSNAGGRASYAGSAYGADGPYGAGVNKKEELWKRRWARAKTILDERGVVLKAWRVGGDVAKEVVRLVEMEKEAESRRS